MYGQASRSYDVQERMEKLSQNSILFDHKINEV